MSDPTSDQFDGVIDNVMVLDQVLDANEIRMLYYSGVVGYDNNGNITVDRYGWRYYYDCENRCYKVEDVEWTILEYINDYMGRRVKRLKYGIPSVTTKYCYDGAQVIGEYDGSDNLQRKYVYGPGIDEPICIIDVTDNNAVYYYHYDSLGSVVALSDESAMIVEKYEYDIFGKPTIYDESDSKISDSAVGNRYMFTGRRYDPRIGLYYYRARYYHPEIGRFLQPDPIGYSGGLNLYTYVGNNPINLVDPYGLVGGGIGGSGTGGAFPVGATGGVQFVFDDEGNMGLFFHGGAGGYVGGSGSAMADFSVFGGTIYDLEGFFTSYGGSGGVFGGGGIEVNLTDHWLTDLRGSAITVSVGLYGGIPGEVHAFREYGLVASRRDIISWPIYKRCWGGVFKKAGAAGVRTAKKVGGAFSKTWKGIKSKLSGGEKNSATPQESKESESQSMLEIIQWDW